MATSLINVAEVHPEDVELVEKLAKLQQMHQQVNDLRKLLPTALFGPAREAISQPRQAPPRVLAVAVSKAAQNGNQEVQAFKKDWHDEKTRQLFKEANAANTPQGIDAWLVDYRALNAMRGKGTTTASRADDITFDSLENAKAAIDNFQKPDKHLKVEVSSDLDSFPLTVHVARLRLKVLRDESEAIFKIEQESNEGNSKLSRQVVDQVNKKGPFKKLDELLASLNAYYDLRIRKCEKCQSLVDSNFDLPIVRKHSANMSKTSSPSMWLAYHVACAE